MRRIPIACRILWLILATLLTSPSHAIAATAPAKRPAPRRTMPTQPQPPKQGGVRAFLDVKIWYIDYEVTVSRKSANMEMHSSTTARFALDHSDLGPTITIIQEAPKMDAYDFVNQIGNSRYWMIHAPEGDDQASAQRYLDSLMMLQQLTYRFDSDVEHTAAQGIGKLMGTPMPFQFEVDVKKKIYALKCPYEFHDLPSTGTKVRGTTRRRDGDKWITEPFERDFSSLFPTWRTVTPPLNGIEVILKGKLPDQVGTIAATDTFQYEGYGDDGTIVIHYELSPTPPSETELVFLADAHYKSWRPNSGDDESTHGPDPLFVVAKLQKKGGGPPAFKATRFTYRLLNTSKELGVCLNWPQSPLAEQPFDLQLVQDTDGPGVQRLDIEPDGQKAVETRDDMTEAKVRVASFDWGGHGAIQIVADLENGNQVMATLPGTGERSQPLPYRKSGTEVAWVWAAYKGVLGVADDSDDENVPAGDGFHGDGFTQYEEYRGFMEGGKWTDANPKKKDVFVLNLIRTVPAAVLGIKEYERLTELEVHHKLVETEVRLDKVINFHHSAGPHLVDQHVIYIREGGSVDEETGLNVSNVFEVGTPGTASSVNIYLNRDPEDPSDAAAFQSRWVVTHEMLHDSNVYHHGERDTQVAWHVSVDADGVVHVSEDDEGLLIGPSRTIATIASWVGLAEVNVRYEDGSLAQASDIPSDKVFVMGEQHGQHSGNNDCVMRYDVSRAYRSLTDPKVRYLAIPKEKEGHGLCSDPEGTEVNDPNRTKPQPRYGNAAMSPAGSNYVKAARGDCKHQIRVNDMGEEPKR